jgi:hypothetical protein
MSRQIMSDHEQIFAAEFEAPGVAINSAVITETKTVKYFKISVVGLELFKSVNLSVALFNDTCACVGVRNYTIDGQEYLAWQNDDQYLLNLVSQKLGFTLSE